MRTIQFRALYRVFLLRIVDFELLSSDADPAKLIGQFASIFFTISFFCTVPVPFLITGRKPIPVPAKWAVEHFLIETSMTIAGLIAVLGWDSAFPDRRDMLVLGPLPLRSHTLFFSKVAAFFAAPFLAILSFNLCTGLGWPMVFAVGVGGDFSLLRTFPAYWLTIAAAGAFLVFTLLAVQGLVANLLPRQIYLRFSAVLQASALCLLLAVYLLGPSFNSPAALASPANQRIAAFLPAYWFLGLFNQLNGSMRPELIALAHRAWTALGVSAFGALSTLLLSYFRTLPKIVEQPDILPIARTFAWSPRIGSPLQTAISMFTLRTLFRSRQHRMILSFYLGIGLALVAAYLKTPLGSSAARSQISPAVLLASILLLILAVLGVRVVASFPITLPANWIMRITQLRPARSYQNAVRFSWFVVGVMPITVITGIAFFAHYPSHPVLAHIAVMILLGALLVELCLFTFPKIPFTCSYLPGKANIHFVFWASVLGVIQLLYRAAKFEDRTLHHLSATVFMLTILLAAAALVHAANWVRCKTSGDLLFEESYPPEVVTLNLD